MALTPQQRTTLKADALATPSLATAIGLADWAAVSNYYNALATPNYTVWKTNVALVQIGDAIVATELAGMTALNLERLRTIAIFAPSGINPSLADRRAAFDDVFSGAGGALTRPILLALWKRLARNVEKLFATGNGADATPSTMTYEGTVSAADIQQAMLS